MRNLVFLLFSLFVAYGTLAQNKELDKKLKGFDQFVDKVMKDWKVQGMAVAIIYKD